MAVHICENETENISVAQKQQKTELAFAPDSAARK